MNSTVAVMPMDTPGVTGFELDECGATDGRTLRHDGRRDAPAQASLTNIAAQLSQNPRNRQGVTVLLLAGFYAHKNEP
jgi:hypothetical protein